MPCRRGWPTASSRRHALIVAQVIKLGEKLTDDAVTLFIKLTGGCSPRCTAARNGGTWTIEKGDVYPALMNHIGAPINIALILDHWDDLLHLAASITTHAVVPSTILTFSAQPKENQLAKALREPGRIERDLWTHARENLDAVTVTLSNRAYAILQDEMRNVGVVKFGRNARRMLDLDSPWARRPRAPRRSSKFSDLFDAAISQKGPFLIEAII